MTRQVLLTKKAERDLQKTKRRNYARVVLALLRLRDKESGQGIALRGVLSSYHSFKIANHRIIFALRKNKVLILRIISNSEISW